MNIDYSNLIFKENPNIKNNIIQIKDKLLKVNKENSNLTGWINYPNEITKDEINKINEYAKEIQNKSNVLVVIGIGGSYLGTKAIIDALDYSFDRKDRIEVIYAGMTISSSYLNDLVKYLENKTFTINYVSKSGTTIEPAIAFRILKNLLIKQHKDKFNEYIYVTTSNGTGNSYKEAIENNYKLLFIPDNIGGRYSCFTACGLLPVAVSNINIENILNGAKSATSDFINNDFNNNIALKYAYARNICYQNNKQIESLCVFSPRLKTLLSWWEQLFAESEGKNKKGLLPVGRLFSTDLHSIGQMIQDGPEILFETMLEVKEPLENITIPESNNNYDELDYLIGKDVHYINNQMLNATLSAHNQKGNVPVVLLSIDNLNDYNLGYLMETFMFSCAISAYNIIDDPFNQPAVNEYKNRMYKLLGKK